MCNNTYNIKVVEGNAFALLFPLKRRTYTANIPIDEDIDCEQLQDCKVIFGGVEYTPELGTDGVRILLPATLKKATYDAIITATYQSSEIRAAYFEAVTIVAWNEQSNAEQYIQGSPVVMPAAFVIGGAMTDAELEELKEEYREKNAELAQAIEDEEEAKEEYIEKAAALDDVAQETTSQQILTAVENIDIDTTTIAKQGTNANATLTATQAAVIDGNDTAVGVSKEVRSEVGTGSDTAAETGTLFAIVKWIKNKVNAITGYALQGSDSTKSITTLDASLGDVEDALTYMEEHIMPEYSNLAKQGSNANANISDIQAKIGTPASGQPSDLFAAIAANAGIPTMTIPATTSSQELAPNTLYIFAERMADLTLTLGSPITGIANEYHCFIIVGGTAPTITWPSGISWNGGSAPTIAASKTYEVSILNNVAAYFEV